MIKIRYADNDGTFEEVYEVNVSDEAALDQAMLSFVKVCVAAGYSVGSFDNIVKEAAEEIEDRYSFQDYLCDRTFGY